MFTRGRQPRRRLLVRSSSAVLPRNPDLERRLRLLPPELVDEWEERAAIIQFGAGVTREAAEWIALERVLPCSSG